MTARTILALAAMASLAACGDVYVEPTPSEQMDAELQRVGEEVVEGIDTTGFDALE